uniref:Homeobox domain-containing protein n=1 Tax=Fibrocapsa japonica TaxID=94617 RepID=A0A7S2V6E2_9STRA
MASCTQSVPPHSNTPRCKNELPPQAVKVLKEWLLSPQHIHFPYPTNEEKKDLITKTNISKKQLQTWFTNARRRIWRPLMERMNMTTRSCANGKVFTKAPDKFQSGLDVITLSHHDAGVLKAEENPREVPGFLDDPTFTMDAYAPNTNIPGYAPWLNEQTRLSLNEQTRVSSPGQNVASIDPLSNNLDAFFENSKGGVENILLCDADFSGSLREEELIDIEKFAWDDSVDELQGQYDLNEWNSGAEFYPLVVIDPTSTRALHEDEVLDFQFPAVEPSFKKQRLS